MQNQSKPAISDAQLGRALRRYLADYRDCAIRKLSGQRDEPYVLVALALHSEEGGRTADQVQLSAPTLWALKRQNGPSIAKCKKVDHVVCFLP